MAEFDKVYSKRLCMLADHLEDGKLGHERFDFGTYNDAESPMCGTAGCAIGECPILFPQHWSFGDSGYPRFRGEVDPRISGALFFGINDEEYRHLFVAKLSEVKKYGGKVLGYHATRYEVAAQIRAFLEYKAREIANS